MILLHFLPTEGIFRFILYMVPYLLIGYDILLKAARGIIHGQLLDENFLMAAATVGALILGFSVSGDYTEAVAVMLFYQIGELFQSYAIGKSRKSIGDLLDIRPDHANIERDGKLISISPDEVEIGTVIIVNPGEKIPIDGIVIKGQSSLNTSALTGESLPRDVSVGDSVVSGCINMSGVLQIRTTKEFGESTASKILELMESASSRKARSENFISAFASIYTPAVCISAVLLMLIPPLLGTVIPSIERSFSVWLYRGLTFLVASCPCALVISIPLGFFAGIGRASKEGILIKGSNYIEALSKATCVIFDKTGTLTKGVFEVTEVHSVNIPEEKLMEYAVLAESASSHPIAQSLRRAYKKNTDRRNVTEICELGGLGITAMAEGHKIAVGNEKLMEHIGTEYTKVKKVGSVIHVAVDREYAGYIVISDMVKESSREAVAELKRIGMKKVIMLTGDSECSAKKVAESLDIDEYFCDLLPTDKVSVAECFLIRLKKGEKLIFAGDGINDAPVLSRADIGIAMGALGSEAAIESADVVLMDDDPLKIAKAVSISRKCMGIVRTNIVFAISVKVLSLLLVAAGKGGMPLAIFADVGVMVLAVLNSIRALFVRKL